MKARECFLLDAAPTGPRHRHPDSGRWVHPAWLDTEFRRGPKAIWQLLVIERRQLTYEEFTALGHPLGLDRKAITKKARSEDELDAPALRSLAHETAWLTRRALIYKTGVERELVDADDEQEPTETIGVWKDAEDREEAEDYADSLDVRADKMNESADWVEDAVRNPRATTCAAHRAAFCRAVIELLPSEPIGMTGTRIAEQLNAAGWTTSDFYKRGQGKPWHRDNLRPVWRYLRERRKRLCADPDEGYWLSDDDEQCLAWCASQRERVRHIRLHADFIRDAAAFTFPRTAAEIARSRREAVRREHSDRWKKARDRDGMKAGREQAFAYAKKQETKQAPKVAAIEKQNKPDYLLTDDERALLHEVRELRAVKARKGGRLAHWSDAVQGQHDALFYVQRAA